MSGLALRISSGGKRSRRQLSSDRREFEKPAQCPAILISLFFRGRVEDLISRRPFFSSPLSLCRYAALNHAVQGIVFLQLGGGREGGRGSDRSNPSNNDAFSLVDKFVTIRHASIVFYGGRYLTEINRSFYRSFSSHTKS